MEKHYFKNKKELTLVGNLFKADSKSVVILAHGFTNNKSSQGRFDRIAEAIVETGKSAFAIDFSGCGESDSNELSVEAQVDDLNSAVAYVKSMGYSEITLFGYSLGSLICLKCWTKDIASMVLLGALTHKMEYDWSQEFTQEQLNELDSTGTIKITTSDGELCIIGHQMLKDFEEIDQRQLLQRIECPVLIIHGNDISDAEELQLLENSRKGLPLLSSRSEIRVIEGANHSFKEHIDQVVDLTMSWLESN